MQPITLMDTPGCAFDKMLEIVVDRSVLLSRDVASPTI